jgi:NifB/MoaA-like Fe-S oxidoreductase
MDEYQMYEFFAHKFNYDISPIFKTKIDEKVEKYQHIENKKKEILGDVSKLEVTLDKLQAAIHNPDMDSDAVKKLEKIKESVEATMTALKQDYVGLDLIKKNI